MPPNMTLIDHEHHDSENYGTGTGLSRVDSQTVIATLQERLSALNDLHLTLKHVHWNVVGPNFISVHEMLDPQVALVRGYADELAERISTLGGSPDGTPDAIEKDRSWDNYELRRAPAQKHLAALDAVYAGIIASHRAAIDVTGPIDPVTQDIVITQTAELEKFQWFIHAHLARDAE